MGAVVTVPVPGDRPAADDVQRLERGRELRALVADGTLTEHDVDAVWTYLSVCERLARAEQALAAVEAIAVDPSWDHDDAWGILRDLDAILRASQGGQT